MNWLVSFPIITGIVVFPILIVAVMIVRSHRRQRVVIGRALYLASLTDFRFGGRYTLVANNNSTRQI